MKRDSFVFYKSFWESVEQLERSVQADIILALCRYGITGEIDPALKPVANALFLAFKPQMDANNKRFMNGCKGGNPAFEKGKPNKYYNQKDNQEDNQEDNQKITEKITKRYPNENVNENDIKKKANSFELAKKENSFLTNIQTENSFFENPENAESDCATPTEKTGGGLTIAEKQDLCERRKNEFMNDCAAYVETYGKEMTRAFFDYWTEANKSKTKMRFELEKTWNLALRFKTWENRKLKFNRNESNGKSNGERPTIDELNAAVEIGIALSEAQKDRN